MIDKSLLYYLSHPYTSFGDPGENRTRSAIIETALTYFNRIKVVNPIGFLPRLSDEEAMKRCKAIYSACDALILCEGWKQSKGCREEYRWAVADGKPVFLAKRINGLLNYELVEHVSA